MDCDNEYTNWSLLGFLPSDILREILSYVGSKDIFNIYCAAKLFSFLIHDDYVWWEECRRNSLRGVSSNRTKKTIPKWFTSGNWYHEFQWRYTQVERIELRGHKDIVWDVKHLPVQSSTFDNSLKADDQYKLLSVSDDGTVRIWSADAPTSVHHNHENNCESVPVLSVDVLYSSNHINNNSVASSIVTGSGNGMMSVWDLNTMQKTSYSHSNNYVNYVRQLTGFGGFICMSSSSNKIYLWDFRVSDPVMIKSHSASILSLTQITNNNDSNNNNNAINFDILSTSRDKSIRGWNIRTMSNTYFSHISNPILSSHFDSLSGNVFLGGGFDNRPTLFYRNLAEICQGLPQKDTFLFGHKNRISSITGDNLKVVTAGYDYIINLWDRHSHDIRTPVSFLSGHKNFITSIHLSSDSTSLVSSSADNTLRLYHLKNNFRWKKEFVPLDPSDVIEVKSSLLDQYRFFPNIG